MSKLKPTPTGKRNSKNNPIKTKVKGSNITPPKKKRK